MTELKDYGSDFAADTIEAYEALSQRVKALEARLDWPSDHRATHMRVRVNASRTAKGYSVDATCELTHPDYLGEVGQHLQDIALKRLELLMAKLNAQYPREA